MDMLRKLAPIVLAALVTGCASVTGGNAQKMYVQAHAADGTAVQGAECSLSNDKGTWRVRSPGDTSIIRSNKPMEVKCEKAPLPAGVVSVESGTRAAMLGNIMIGGVVGAVIDHSSGAAYEYPEMIRVVMGRISSFTLPLGGTQAPAGPWGGSSSPAFAAINDAEAVPYLDARARDAYREWLARPHPRAFAVAPNGRFFTAWSTRPTDPAMPADPSERALVACERAAHMPCKLYAVNDRVVWVAETPVRTVAPAPAGATPTARPAPAQFAFSASGYAAVEDVDALPYLSDRGRAAYREWLTRPTPKAFAIGTNGYWYNAWSLTPQDTTLPSDPNERALAGCVRAGGVGCKLYAVNGSVVWKKEP